MERTDVIKTICDTIRENLMEIRKQSPKMTYKMHLSKSTESIYLYINPHNNGKKIIRFSDHQGRRAFSTWYNWKEDGADNSTLKEFIKDELVIADK